MKYLKKYDEFNESFLGFFKNKFKKSFKMGRTFQEWFENEYLPNNSLGEFCHIEPEERIKFEITSQRITDLVGLEKFSNLEEFTFNNNLIENLNGISNLKKLRVLHVEYNTKLKNLSDIEKCTGLTTIFCMKNQLENLKGVENLINLERIDCEENKLRNLDELINLPNLKTLFCHGNPFDYPLPKEFVDKFFKTPLNCFYSNDLIEKFKTYDLQKEFLTKYPDRIKDLEPFGYDEKIKQEFPSLVTGAEWGFFDIESV